MLIMLSHLDHAFILIFLCVVFVKEREVLTWTVKEVPLPVIAKLEEYSSPLATTIPGTVIVGY